MDFTRQAVPQPSPQPSVIEEFVALRDSLDGTRWVRPNQQIALTKEERVRRRWASHDSQWRSFTTKVSDKLGRTPEDSLIVASAAYRSRQEELSLLEHAHTNEPVTTAAKWSSNLRGGGPRMVLLGNQFTGIWAPIGQDKSSMAPTGSPPKNMVVVRQPLGLGAPTDPAGTRLAGAAPGLSSSPSSLTLRSRSMDPQQSSLLTGSTLPPSGPGAGASRTTRVHSATAWRNTGEFARKREEYAGALSKMRPHEVTEAAAEGLVVRGLPLFLWAAGAFSGGGDAPKTRGATAASAAAHGGFSGAASVAPGNALQPTVGSDMARAALVARGVWRVEERRIGGGSGPSGGSTGTSKKGGSSSSRGAILESGSLEAIGNSTGSLTLNASMLLNGNTGNGEGGLGSTSTSMSGVSGAPSLDDAMRVPHLFPGPQLQVVVVRDAVTGPGDVGESLGPAGHLRRIPRAPPTSAAAALAVPLPSAAAAAAVAEEDNALPYWEIVGGGEGSMGQSQQQQQQQQETGSYHTTPSTWSAHVGEGAGLGGSPLLVVSSTLGGSGGVGVLRIANCGTVALFFSWAPSSSSSSNAAAGGGGGRLLNGENEGVVAGTALESSLPGNRFQPLNPSGSVLPGACVDCPFLLMPITPGVFRETWLLTTSPTANTGLGNTSTTSTTTCTPLSWTLKGVVGGGEGAEGSASSGSGNGVYGAGGRARLETRLKAAAMHAAVREVVMGMIDALPAFGEGGENSSGSGSSGSSGGGGSGGKKRRLTPTPTAFTTANPGLFFSQQALDTMGTIHGGVVAAAKSGQIPTFAIPHWDGVSVLRLSQGIAALQPPPESPAEERVRVRVEREAALALEAWQGMVEERGRMEAAVAEAAARAAEEAAAAAAAAAAEAEAAAAASKKGGKGGGGKSAPSSRANSATPSKAGSSPNSPSTSRPQSSAAKGGASSPTAAPHSTKTGGGHAPKAAGDTPHGEGEGGASPVAPLLSPEALALQQLPPLPPQPSPPPPSAYTLRVQSLSAARGALFSDLAAMVLAASSPHDFTFTTASSSSASASSSGSGGAAALSSLVSTQPHSPTLPVMADVKPTTTSSLYAAFREHLLQLIDAIPYIAGAAREREGLLPRETLGVEVLEEGRVGSSWGDCTIKDGELVVGAGAGAGAGAAGSGAGAGASGTAPLVLDVEVLGEILRDQYGPSGRPPPKLQLTRPKLGRDGRYHPVPVGDGDMDPPEIDEEPVSSNPAIPDPSDLPPEDLPLFEPFPAWHRRSEAEGERLLKQREEVEAAAAAAKAAALAAAAAAAAEEKKREEEAGAAAAAAAAAAAHGGKKGAAASKAASKAPTPSQSKPGSASATRATSPTPSKPASAAASGRKSPGAGGGKKDVVEEAAAQLAADAAAERERVEREEKERREAEEAAAAAAEQAALEVAAKKAADAAANAPPPYNRLLNKGLPPIGSERHAALRFAWGVRRFLHRTLSAIGGAGAVAVHTTSSGSTTSTTATSTALPLSVTNALAAASAATPHSQPLLLAGKVVLYRAEFDHIPHELLQGAAKEQDDEEREGAGGLFSLAPSSPHSCTFALEQFPAVTAILPTLSTLSSEGGPCLIVLVSPQGTSNAPFPDEVCGEGTLGEVMGEGGVVRGRGGIHKVWPPLSSSPPPSSSPFAIATSMGYSAAPPSLPLGSHLSHEGHPVVLATSPRAASSSSSSPSSSSSLPHTFSSSPHFHPITHRASTFKGLALPLASATSTPVVFISSVPGGGSAPLDPAAICCHYPRSLSASGGGGGGGGVEEMDGWLSGGIEAALGESWDLASFIRAFAKVVCSSGGGGVPPPLVLIENLLAPSTAWGEVGGKGQYPLTRSRSAIAAPFSHPLLNTMDCAAWDVPHSALWLRSLRPNAGVAGVWGKYEKDFIGGGVKGATLEAWARALCSTASGANATTPSGDAGDGTWGGSVGLIHLPGGELFSTWDPEHVTRVERALGHLALRCIVESVESKKAEAIDRKVWGTAAGAAAGATGAGAGDGGELRRGPLFGAVQQASAFPRSRSTSRRSSVTTSAVGAGAAHAATSPRPLVDVSLLANTLGLVSSEKHQQQQQGDAPPPPPYSPSPSRGNGGSKRLNFDGAANTPLTTTITTTSSNILLPPSLGLLTSGGGKDAVLRAENLNEGLLLHTLGGLSPRGEEEEDFNLRVQCNPEPPPTSLASHAHLARPTLLALTLRASLSSAADLYVCDSLSGCVGDGASSASGIKCARAVVCEAERVSMGVGVGGVGGVGGTASASSVAAFAEGGVIGWDGGSVIPPFPSAWRASHVPMAPIAASVGRVRGNVGTMPSITPGLPVSKGGPWTRLDGATLAEVKRTTALREAQGRREAAGEEVERLRRGREVVTRGVLGGIGERREVREAAEAELERAIEAWATAEVECETLERAAGQEEEEEEEEEGGEEGEEAGLLVNAAATTPTPTTPGAFKSVVGLRVAGCVLAPILAGLLPLVQPYKPEPVALTLSSTSSSSFSSHSPPPSLVILSSGPHSLLAKAGLLEALVHPYGGNPGAYRVMLGGVLGLAWLAFHPSSRGSVWGRVASALGLASTGTLVWRAVEAPITRAFHASAKSGVVVSPPLDLLASPHHGHADPRLWNPSSGAAPAPAAPAATAIPRVLKRALRKPIPGEVWDYDEEGRECEEAWLDFGASGTASAREAREALALEMEEDGKLDEDYDSDDSQDMEDLLRRNTRRREREVAANAAAATATATAAAIGGCVPITPTAFPLLAGIAGDAGALASQGSHPFTGVALPCAPGCPRPSANGGTWTPPWGIEGAVFEQEGGGLPPGLDAQSGPRPLPISPTSQPTLLALFAEGMGGTCLDVGPSTSEDMCEAIATTAGWGGGIYVFGTLGVCELGEGAGVTGEVCGALGAVATVASNTSTTATAASVRSLGGLRSQCFAVGGSLCATVERLGLGGGIHVKVPSPGAGVALLLGAAKTLPGLSTLGAPSVQGFKALSRVHSL